MLKRARENVQSILGSGPGRVIPKYNRSADFVGLQIQNRSKESHEMVMALGISTIAVTYRPALPDIKVIGTIPPAITKNVTPDLTANIGN